MRELLLKLVDSVGLLKDGDLCHLLLLVLTIDVNLLAPPLAADLEQVRTRTLGSCDRKT